MNNPIHKVMQVIHKMVFTSPKEPDILSAGSNKTSQTAVTALVMSGFPIFSALTPGVAGNTKAAQAANTRWPTVCGFVSSRCFFHTRKKPPLL